MPETRTIKLTVCYDGTDYCGWARQPGQPTVQGTLESALTQLCNHPVLTNGAGRTDAGVHALGQVVAFETASPIPPERFAVALNGLLPPAISVVKSEAAPTGFHASRQAVGKLYRYRLYVGHRPPGQLARYVWAVPYPLDVVRMQQAAAFLIGKHDFTSFAAVADERESKVRTIQAITLTRRPCTLTDGAELDWPIGDEIQVDVCGDGFLYHMVRNIVGTLVDVTRRGAPPETMRNILSARNRCAAGITAPAAGLCLLRVRYDK